MQKDLSGVANVLKMTPSSLPKTGICSKKWCLLFTVFYTAQTSRLLQCTMPVQTKKAVYNELHHIFGASYQLWHLEWYVWLHIPCLFILQFLLKLAAFFSIYCWQCWFGELVWSDKLPRFFGYRPEQYVQLLGVTSRVTANSRLILDIL